MPPLSGKSLRNAFLPEGAAHSLERLGLRLVGLVTVTGGLLLATALASYQPGDPSWNTATDAGTANALGRFGAVVADLFLQSLGFASVLPVLCLVVWGTRLMAASPLPAWGLRLPAAILASLLLAVGLAVLPGGWFWPLTARPGGFVGGLVLDRLGELLGAGGSPGGNGQVLVAAPAAGAAFLVLLYAFGLTLSDWTGLGRLFGRGGLAVAGLAVATVALFRRGGSSEADETGEADGNGRRMPTFGEPAGDAPDGPDGRATADGRTEGPAGTGPTADGSGSGTARAPDSARAATAAPARTAAGRRDPSARTGGASLVPPAGDALYRSPPLTLLTLPETGARPQRVSEDQLGQNARVLETVLADFGVQGRVVKVRPGPVVTLYELDPAPGTKTSRVIGLADDIARSMSALAVRIAVVPGQSVIGIELPNARRETVYLRELLAADGFDSGAGKLVLALGKDIGGTPLYVDLARMPHLLIAGTTGSGKSVAVNTMIVSLLYRLAPKECRLIMIDPKMLELSVYDGIPHLLAPVVTEPAKAVIALKWAVKEMENRYRAMSQLGVRNIAGYNQRVEEAKKAGQTLNRTVQTGFDPETGKPVYEDQTLALDPLPFIVVVVDEMADLMLVAGKDVEAAIQRLAQMARAAGIHLIMATQRPSVDVITGTIKANFPTRVSFQVTSKIDSRTILGEQGAEQLLGQGDMLYMAAGGRITRVHGPFVSDGEVEAVVGHLRTLGAPTYLSGVTEEEEDEPAAAGVGPGGVGSGGDKGAAAEADLYGQAVAVVLRERKCSTSFIQRNLQIGYNRAARIVERMEADGLVSRPNHVGKREVLAPPSG